MDISFIASLAPITTAVKFDGRCEGGRLTLDIPDSDIAQLARMLTLREQIFRVTIAPLSSDEGGVHDGE
jgi:hypothetical protein